MPAKQKGIGLDVSISDSDVFGAENHDSQEQEDDLFVGRGRTQSDNNASNLGYHCLQESRRPPHLPPKVPYWNAKF